MIENSKSVSQRDLEHVLATVGGSWQQLQHSNIFLTGGTGFVGKWLLETVLHADSKLGLNCRVTVLSRDPEKFAKSSPHLAARVNLLQGDVRSLVAAAENFDVVIHAATDIAEPNEAICTFDTCVTGTRRVLDFSVSAKAKHFLLISSGAVYGRQPVDMRAIPESYRGAPDPLDVRAAYGVGKLAAEWLASTYGRNHGIDVKIARCFAFAGPYLPFDKHFAIGNFVLDALTKRDVEIKGDGTAYRSYLYAADLSIWLWTILLRGAAGTAYNVGGDEAVTMKELAQRVMAALSVKGAVTILQPSVEGRLAERYVPDLTKAYSELKLRVEISLDEAIRRTAEWYRLTC